MTLKEFKSSLENRNDLSFIIENGIKIPAYFHITEMGLKNKHFMDCGGVMRKDSKITFQLWTSDDYEHRLSSYKLSAIIKKAESLINEDLDNLEIEMEYQDYTIGIYSVNLIDDKYILEPTLTDCLAKEACGIDETKQEIETSECCTSDGCC
jgi:hypothetical protein